MDNLGGQPGSGSVTDVTARQPLPHEIGSAFSVRAARDRGIQSGRLRGPDLERPFHGVRRRGAPTTTRDTTHAAAAARGASNPRPRRGREQSAEHPDAYALAREDVLARVHAYAPRLRLGQFFSHETAAMLWGAPLPLGGDARIHVSSFHPRRPPRTRGVVGHQLHQGIIAGEFHDGLPVSSPSSTWAMLGRLPHDDLVALGDFFVRVWRAGYLRPDAGRPPLATLAELRGALDAGRREGAARLRAALAEVRTDSWSPNESKTRCVLSRGGLPEPTLNLDVFGDSGEHLGCVDLAYPKYRVAVEYHGLGHATRFARDVDRAERLRAAGWIIIEVTWPLLFERPAELVSRVAAALATRGWRP